jgi:tetratricopeptide (TPR) repeat protein
MTKSIPRKIEKQSGVSKSVPTGWIIGLLIVVGVVAFLPTLKCEFIFDDRALVENNPLLRGAGGIKEVLTSGRTLRMITLVVDHALWGMNPPGYHVTNIILHVLTGLMVFWVFRRITGQTIIPMVLALIFLCHPLTTEAVASIANRKESLHSLFSLLAIWAYFKADDKRWWFAVAFLSFLLALTSKEVAIAVPLLILVIDWLVRERNLIAVLRKRGWFLGLMIVPIIMGAVYRFRTTRLGDILDVDVTGGMPYPNVAATSLNRIVDYLRLTVVPHPLSADYYTVLVQSFFNIKTLLGILIVVGLVGGGFLLRKRQPLITLSFWWIFITWLPISNLYPSAYFLAERYFYFPLLGVVLLAAIGWEALRKFSGFAWVVLGLVVVMFSALTLSRCRSWENEYKLWWSTLRHQPDNPKAHYYFANALRERGRFTDAVVEFRKAVELKDDFIWAWVNLGNLYTIGRHFDHAIPTYEKVMELDPNLSVVHNNLGCAYYNMGEVEKASDHYQRAVELNPKYAEAWNNIGVAFYEDGEIDSAVIYFYRAITNSTTWPEPYQRIIQGLIELGRLDKAKIALDRYLELPYIPDREAREEQREKIISILDSAQREYEKGQVINQ